MPVEEQTQYNMSWALKVGVTNEVGQRLTIPDRTLTHLGFWLYKEGTPTLTVTYQIRHSVDESLIYEQVACDQDALTGTAQYIEIELDTPQELDEAVVINAQASTGATGQCCRISAQDENVKDDELLTRRTDIWSDFDTYDLAYRYTYAEVQLQHDAYQQTGVTDITRVGQKLTIPNRRVTKLAFVLRKTGSPSGNINFVIRRVSNDAVILTKVWGNATSVTTTPTWYEAEFDTPETIDEEVRLLVESEAPFYTDFIQVGYKNANVKADELYCHYIPTAYTDTVTKDTAYKYNWEEPEPAPPGLENKSANMAAKMIAGKLI